MIDIDKWLKEYQNTVKKAFGKRIIFIGLQGSYAREEATDNSDIDIVLILDIVSFDDLKVYKEITKGLPYRELLCGFVSGVAEITSWNKSELFQFYHDTVAVQGRLEDIISRVTIEDARLSVLVGACHIYHACSHNYLHTVNTEILLSLFKSAFFILQAKYYCENGIYIRSRSGLINGITNDDKRILEVSMQPSNINENTLGAYSEMLLVWSGELIHKYKFNN